MRCWGVLVAVSLAFACRQSGMGSVLDVRPDGGDGGPGAVPPTRWPPSRSGYTNPIPAENQRSGDPAWDRGFNRSNRGQLEAYADRVSANAGDTIQLMVRSDRNGASASWALFRLGWYGGAGARRILSSSRPVFVGAQPACPPDATTGLVRCSWMPSFTLSLPPDAVSGLYVVRIVRDDAFGALIPLVVKDDRPADLLMESAVLTAQAYNNWGGTGLYDPRSAFAVQVSFDRPYASDSGSGQMLRYEALMARFLERYGYDVTYTTNLDVAREGAETLLRRGALLSVGHDEYWPGEQRDAVEAARDAGEPIFFFGANAGYWKVRLSSPGVDGNARVVTCYKRRPQDDPLAGNVEQTGRFRDPSIGRPEEQLVGTMYESWMLFGQSWVVHDDAHAIYEGTGLTAGDSISQLVGYEYDRTFELDTPAAVDVVAQSPLVDAEGKPGISEGTVYTAPGGALVFGAGSIFWARGVDGPLRDARVERMTANLLKLGLDLPVPAALSSVSGAPSDPPSGMWASSVRTVAGGMSGPTGVAQLPNGTFVIADARGHRIWQTNGAGAVWPYAGDGHPNGSSRFDNVPGLSARFFAPTAVLPDAAGNVYVADTHNCVIRKIGNDAKRTVTTVAGAFMVEGHSDGIGAAARFGLPMGMAWLDSTHIVIADSSSAAIRVLDVQTRAVTTLAVSHGPDETDGPGLTAASFQRPTAVAVAPDGRIFFVASPSGTVKMIGTDASRTVTTLVAGGLGFADGPGTGARLLPQMGLLWLNGALIVSDPGNQRLRWVSPGATAGSTTVKTWAGNGRSGTDDGSGSAASFEVPLGLWNSKDGNVYVVDGTAGTLRTVRP